MTDKHYSYYNNSGICGIVDFNKKNFTRSIKRTTCKTCIIRYNYFYPKIINVYCYTGNELKTMGLTVNK